MSNLPELLKNHAEGLRKEAQLAIEEVEALGYCAEELFKQASDAVEITDLALQKSAEFKKAVDENGLEKVAEFNMDLVDHINGLENAIRYKEMQKKAAEIAVKELVARGLDTTIAEAAVAELNRRMA